MAGGGFDEGLKQELIKQGIAELEDENLGPWANSMNTSKMLAEAGMTSKELVKEVLNRAGDKPSPKLGQVSQNQTEKLGAETVQDATEETQLELFG